MRRGLLSDEDLHERLRKDEALARESAIQDAREVLGTAAGRRVLVRLIRSLQGGKGKRLCLGGELTQWAAARHDAATELEEQLDQMAPDLWLQALDEENRDRRKALPVELAPDEENDGS